MAAGAAFEVDGRRLLEFFLRHDRIVSLAAWNLDLDLAECRHGGLIGSGRAIAVLLWLLIRQSDASGKSKDNGCAGQQQSPHVGGTLCHGVSLP